MRLSGLVSTLFVSLAHQTPNQATKLAAAENQVEKLHAELDKAAEDNK